MRKIEKFRVRLFWEKMISGNHFPPNPRVWQQWKMKFSGKSLLVDRNLLLWPGNDFTLLFSLQIISRSRKTQREREKECKTQREREKEQHTKRASKTQREREKERELRSSHRHRSTSRRSRRAQLDDHRAKRRKPTVSESSNSHRSNPTHPIQLSQSITVQPLRSPSQTQTHSEFSETDSPSTHSPHLWSTHLTSPTHPLDPPPDSISALYIYMYIYIYYFIYIFIYINIYIIIYFFYLLIFLIIHFLLNCVFMGYAYEILELFWLFRIGFWLDVFLEFWSLTSYAWLVFAVICFRIWLVGLCVKILELDPCFYSVILFKIPLLL